MEIRKRLLADKYLILVLCLVFFSRLVLAAEEKVETTTITQPSVEVKKKLLANYSDTLLSVEADGVFVKELFEEISRKTGIETFVDSIIKEKISIKFENLKLKEGLEKIINSIGNKNYGLVYKKGEKDELEVGKVYLIKRLEGVEDEEMAEIMEGISKMGGRKKRPKFDTETKKRLINIGEKAIPKLIDMLDSEGAELINADPHSLSLDEINCYLLIRQNIIELLYDIDDDKTVIPILEKELENWERIYIPNFGLENPGVTGLWNVVRIKLNQVKERKEVRDKLGLKEKTADEKIKILIDSLTNDEDAEVVQRDLEKIGKPAWEYLFKIVKDKNNSSKLRANALFPLYRISLDIGNNETLIDLLIELVNEKEEKGNSIRGEAVKYLNYSVDIKNINQRVVNTLLEALKTYRDSSIIIFASNALFNVKDERGLPILIEYFKDNDDVISASAEEILVNYYSKNKYVMGNMGDIIKTSVLKNKKRALSFLEKTGREEAISILEEAKNDPEIKEIIENTLERMKRKKR